MLNSIQDCEICQLLDQPSYELLQTPNWRVSLSQNQAYLGRAYVTLRHHKDSLSELNAEEWHEFQSIVQKLENANRTAFGASPISWGSLWITHFGNALHVHWRVFPRYKHAQTLEDVVFDDPRYGDLFDHKAERIVNDELMQKIVQKITPCM